MDTTLEEIQKLEAKLVELDKKQIELENKKEQAIKLHQESVDCYIGIIELALWEKKNKSRNNNNEGESKLCKCQDMELVPIFEAIVNSIKLLNSRLDKL
jgi:hypothetical protein